jgi:NTP pyrophosphatase (non-canonical NTP hydrolase)
LRTPKYGKIKQRQRGGDAMTANEYQKLAMRTLNPDMTEKDVLINGVMGLCGEAGEAIDIVKKHLAQGHPLDRERLAAELGDIAWYLAETATALGYTLEEILRMNIEKLKKRYPEGFEATKSISREEAQHESE